MTTTFQEKETGKEKTVREALEAVLEPSETLLEYTLTRYSAAIWSNQEYWIGLTGQRLIFLKPRKRSQPFSMRFAFIAGLVYGGAKLDARPALRLALGAGPGIPAVKGDMAFTSFKMWKAHSARLAEQYARVRAAWDERPLPPTVQQAVQQVQDLEEMGLWNEAQALMKARMQADPYFQADEEAQDLRRQLNDGKLAMRVAAGLFTVVILFLLWFAIQGMATVGLGIVLAVIAIFNLVRGNAAARGTALGLALLTVGLNVVINAIASSLLDVIVWCAFGLAMCLLLIGSPNRLRIGLGGLVFGLGSVGMFAFFMLGVRYYPNAVQWLLPQPAGPFVEAFTSIDRWSTVDNAAAAANWESGAYFMQIKQPKLLYFSFPPVTYFPVRGEVEARAPANDFGTVPGYFGMACRYQKDAHKYYSIYVDPYSEAFLIVRVEGDQETPLADPAWLPASGLKEASQANRIGLSCQDNQVALTINGVQQTPVSDPAMAQFGDGKLGLLAASTGQLPAEGFKVLFDNAEFWPAGN